MKHRHLAHEEFTLAAIDDIIGRGRRADWAELRSALLANPGLRDKIARVCAAHIKNPYAQRYRFWNYYVQKNNPS